MNPNGGFTGGLSPDAVQTELDAALWESYTRTEVPQYLAASDSFFFHQSSTDKLAFVWAEDQGIPNFQLTEEQEEILNTDSSVTNATTKASRKFTMQVPVSDEAFRTDQVGKRGMLGKQIGDAARRSQDQQSILDTFGDAFAGSVNTTPDGQAWASNAHVAVQGATVDNLETAALTPDALWTSVQSLANQTGQHGDAGSHNFEGIVVPINLYRTVKEIMNSTLIPNSAENNINVFDTDYGQVNIKASIFLGTTYNTATNAATSYHLLGRNHFNMRKVLYGLNSKLIAPEYTANDSYLYRAKFHEVAFPGSWTAYVGNNGSA